jgi:hypothetical protein
MGPKPQPLGCSVCSGLLSPGDRHSRCILHRECTRLAPCALDIGMLGDYWDDIDSALMLFKTERRVSKRNVTCPRPKAVSSKVSSKVSTKDKKGKSRAKPADSKKSKGPAVQVVSHVSEG